MKYFLITATTCLLSALLMPPVAWAAPVLQTPEKLPDACWNTLHTIDGPVAAYRVRNPKVWKDDPTIIDFTVSGGNAKFHVKFADGLNPSVRKHFINNPGDLFVVFVEPGTVVPTADEKTVLDYFVIAHGTNHQGEAICQNVTDTNWLPAESRRHMPKMVQKLMDMVKDRKAETIARAPSNDQSSKTMSQPVTYRNFTSRKMVEACGADYITEHLHPLTIGYKVTGGESGIGTGLFYFTIEDGVDGFRYEIDETNLTLTVKSMLNATGKEAATLPENEQRQKLFAVFGPPKMNEQGGNVSIMLFRWEGYLTTPRCMLMTDLQTTYLLPQHMPEKVREERTRSGADNTFIEINY